MPSLQAPELQRRHVVSSLLTVLAALPCQAWAHGKKPKVAAIYSVPFEQQWVSRIHIALSDAQKHNLIDYQGTENISNFEYPQALRDCAKQAPDVIFGEAFQIEQVARQVAAEFRRVMFVMGSSGRPQAPNFSVFDSYIHEPVYLAGMIAGGMSKRGQIGLIGGFAIPEVNRLMNAFMDGARDINPNAQFMTAQIGSWLNPPRARRLTLQMIDAGVDAVFAATMAGVVETAAEKGIYAFGNVLDAQAEYPKTVVASAIWNVEPTVKAVLADWHHGNRSANDYGPWSLMHRKGASLSSLGTFEKRVPVDLMERVRKKEQDILTGQFVVKINDVLALTMSDNK